MELNHETITDWADTSNTDIPIINTQYTLAKSVALTMYQWSWAFKYAKLATYEYVFDMPADRLTGADVYSVPTAMIEQSAGDSLDDLAVDVLAFMLQVTESGDYVFTFDGSDWQYDGSTVDLNDYGITFTGTPVIDDAITVVYSAGFEIPYISDEKNVYANSGKILLGYVNTSNIQSWVILTGSDISATVCNYKKATLLPTDFAGYLACYFNDKLSILADYVTVGNVIYTNADVLYIKYISDVDESVFPPEFVDWFKMFLAQRLNGYLNGDMQRQQLLNSEEPFFFRKAKNIDSKRNKHDSLNGNPMLWVRGKIGGAV